MFRLILPLVIALMGIAGGLGAGYVMKPAPEALEAEKPECPEPEEMIDGAAVPVGDGQSEYVKLNNQFVIPVIEDGRVTAMVVASLSMEVSSGQRTLVYDHEPKLRDAYNEVFFLHANAGGFAGAFTDPVKMNRLRLALLHKSQELLGNRVRAVLIDSIMRQDN